MIETIGNNIWIWQVAYLLSLAAVGHAIYLIMIRYIHKRRQLDDYLCRIRQLPDGTLSCQFQEGLQMTSNQIGALLDLIKKEYTLLYPDHCEVTEAGTTDQEALRNKGDGLNGE